MISDIFRWSPRQFKTAEASGWFDGSKVELLGGIVYRMTTKPPHMIAVYRLVDALRTLAPEPQWVVTKEDNIQLGTWLPLPEATVLRGPIENYGARLPRARDVVLVVEVSDTTYVKDRGRKWRRYASCRLPIYWIVDLDRRQVEVFSSPVGKSYSAVQVFHEGETVPVVVDGRQLGTVSVSDILPRALDRR